ncbi:MAG: HAMP domain-containing histidine kinase, partial [Deltaproteobacteria bacterium]|nr:HAMP domain-containing histidine kinase [Deltaproteobacteria bacterium]
KLFSLEHKTPKDLKNNGGKWQLPLLILLLLLLPVMAGLQHHYLGKLSEGEKLRLKTNLEIATKNFTKDFDSELMKIQQAFMFEEYKSIGFESRFNKAYLSWRQTTSFHDLIKGIYFWDFQDEKSNLYIFNREKGILSPSDWPKEFDKIKINRADKSESLSGSFIYLPSTPISKKYPLIITANLDDPITNNMDPQKNASMGYMITVLDPDFVRNKMLPILIEKHFSLHNDLQVDIAIAKGNKPDDLFYISNPELDITDFNNAEFLTEIGRLDPMDAEHSKDIKIPRFLKINKTILPEMIDKRSFSLLIMNSLKIVVQQPETWELMVKFRNDTLEGIVAKARHRNLIISYCIIIILGISVVMVYVSSRRAGTLARRQLKFVSGVSHELRTPLSVIRSAGENLADGVITDMEQQKQYGRLIRDEGRRLSTMVENVLSFSALQNGKTILNLKAARIIDILEEFVNSRSGSNDLPKRSIKIESDDNVFQVKVDYNSIKIAFNNIIENCIKYSPDDSPILIRICYESSDNQLAISFEDHGRGIDPDDLPYIFDPFFRGKNTEDQRTPGSGIGLSLVNDIIKKHGGRIEVKSHRNKGTTVSVFLPVSPDAVEA